MALLDEVKVALRVTSDALDPEIAMWIDAAKADMHRVGVPRDLLYDGVMDPYVQAAVTLYVKANFGYDNDEAQRFESTYRQMVCDILNSPSRFRTGGGEDGEVD